MCSKQASVPASFSWNICIHNWTWKNTTKKRADYDLWTRQSAQTRRKGTKRRKKNVGDRDTTNQTTNQAAIQTTHQAASQTRRMTTKEKTMSITQQNMLCKMLKTQLRARAGIVQQTVQLVVLGRDGVTKRIVDV